MRIAILLIAISSSAFPQNTELRSQESSSSDNVDPAAIHKPRTRSEQNVMFARGSLRIMPQPIHGLGVYREIKLTTFSSNQFALIGSWRFLLHKDAIYVPRGMEDTHNSYTVLTGHIEEEVLLETSHRYHRRRRNSVPPGRRRTRLRSRQTVPTDPAGRAVAG
jgi:hypothetical protein